MACVKKRRGKWVVDWRDCEGKRHWETVLDKKAARDRLAEILKGGATAPVLETRTFKEYGDWWLENCARGAIKASTYQEYGAVLKNHVYPTLGALPFMEIRRPQIRELIAAKKAEGVRSVNHQKHHGAGARHVLSGHRGRHDGEKSSRAHRKAQ